MYLGVRQNGAVGPTRWISFNTSGAPTVGTCSITPQDGLNDRTSYRAQCQGFTDAHEPLTFKVYRLDMFDAGLCVIQTL